jgi:23S rRNA G2069 N7-methylase RlmK/C1962 C5-methylase RlmI
MNTNKVEWLINRIKKNSRKLSPLIKKWKTNAYRIYDKDIPEIPYQIDRLGIHFWITEKGLHSSKLPPELKHENQEAIESALKQLFNAEEKNLWWQTREDIGITIDHEDRFEEVTVMENECQFLLKLGTYRDTGLFLDHRPLRLNLAKLEGIPLKVLNLFCYTSSFSVHLAKHGHKTTNVDLSKTYLDWSKANFQINQIDLSTHRFLQEDILDWLINNQEARHSYDLIILDPPSFSNSKRMGNVVLDIQRDHEKLILQCLDLLKKNSGVLYFSTNLRTFKLNNETLSDQAEIENITQKTIPEDFRDQKIHQCYKITHRYK